VVSIIVPAYNEGRTVERCLSSMLEGTAPGEFEVVVVANGCTDDTAARARKFASRGVKVIETPVGSKSNALNLGDEAATRFPRFYVDADIVLSPAAIRDVAAMLERDPELVVASPRPIVDYADRSLLVRSYYRVWTQLPYVTEGFVGSGVYAFSRQGRARFERFPDIIADDEFARLQAAPHERRCSDRSSFHIKPPTTLRAILHINTRVRAGNYELREKFPELVANDNTTPARSLRVIARTPRLWPHAPLYLGMQFLAKLRAHRKLRQRAEKIWERDESSRAEPTGGHPRS
jgi:glycosyltransferase involved in cell wall biosynthesis